MIIFVRDDRNHLSAFIAIHSRGNNDGPSFGATRFWTYKHDSEAIKDALKLSRIMSYKAALAGLQIGGAKGVIMASPIALKRRRKVLRAYARRVNALRGGFITGTDVGVSNQDIPVLQKESPYFVGSRVDPAKYTSIGVYISMRTCLKKVFGSNEVFGRTFAIQGLGKIGMELLRLIYKDSKTIFVSDIDKNRIKIAKQAFPNIIIVNPEEIHRQNVDVFSPCALSNSLTPKTVSEIKASIIAGGANNQLQNDKVGELMYKFSILYAPDYVINAGGLISVVDEYEHRRPNHLRIMSRIKEIEQRLQKIITESEKNACATNIIADKMAKKQLAKKRG
jgi:leucine dehydrogenase